MRTPPLMSLIAVLLACFALSCAHAPPSPVDDPWEREAAALDSVAADAFAALPAAERDRRRRLAEEGLRTLRFWRPDRPDRPDRAGGAGLDFATDAGEAARRDLARDRPDGRAFAETVRRCRRVVAADPAYARVWYELGRIGVETGDWARAEADLEAAWRALARDPRARREPRLEQEIALAGAWLCYDRGLWREGLDWLDRHRGAWGPDEARQEMLARGLLLAGAGRFQEAYLAALRMPPLRTRDIGAFTRGLGTHQAGYANRWIQAMAWYHQGETAFALHALGTPGPRGVHVPQMSRYWNDVGLLHESVGRVEEARLDYALALFGRAPMLHYLPFGSYSHPAVLFGQPDVTVPFFTLYEDRYLGGSLFGFGCQLMADCAAAADAELRDRSGRRAREAFTVCMRRLDRPVLAQALRGRTRFYMGEGEAALPDLLAARDALRASGRVDAATSTVIGTILVNADRPAEAVADLAEAVAADPELPVAWRTYGVALAGVNRHAEADSAMDCAVALDPLAVGGWYNRGLHHLNRKRFAAAREDLLVAAELAPDNPQIRQLKARLERDWDLAADPELQAAAEARADSIRSAISSGDWLARRAADDLGLRTGPRSVAPGDVDFAARADSLAAAYADHPTAEGRRELAATELAAGRPERALEPLVPLWPEGLTPPERLLVLQADRDLGCAVRARDMALSLSRRAPTIVDLDFWTLVALTCLDAGERETGLRALDFAVGLAPANHALRSFRRLLADTAGGP